MNIFVSPWMRIRNTSKDDGYTSKPNKMKILFIVNKNIAHLKEPKKKLQVTIIVFAKKGEKFSIN